MRPNLLPPLPQGQIGVNGGCGDGDETTENESIGQMTDFVETFII